MLNKYLNKSVLIHLLAVAIVHTSCMDNVDDLDSANRLSVAVAVNNTDKSTRAFMTDNYLPDNAQIGVSVVDFSGKNYNASNYNNILYTADGTGDSQTWGTNSEVMLTTTPADIYAYYPYAADAEITRLPIEIQSQTDYMYATPIKGADFSKNQVSLVMNHALSAIKLTLVYNGSLDSPKLNSVSFNSESIATSAYMYAKDGTLSEFTGTNETVTIEVDDIPVTSNENSSASIQYMVIPTGIEGVIHFTCIVSDKTYTMSISPLAALKQGTIHHFVATIDDSSCSLNTVSVDNWTTQGFSVTATTTGGSDIVKAVTANGELIDVDLADNTCIAVALTLDGHRYWIEKNETSNTTWKTVYENSGATNTEYKKFYWGPAYTNITDIIDYSVIAPWDTRKYTYNINQNWLSWGAGTAIADFSGQTNTGHMCASTTTDSYSVYPKIKHLIDEFNKTGNAENFGFTDWYCPALGELALIYIYRDFINKALAKIGGVQFATGAYWSSTECDYNSSYYIYFYEISSKYNYLNYATKNSNMFVRLIRKF